MEFRILGSVEVFDERSGVRTVPTGAKQRALLGALVVKAGQLVPAHRLTDELWGRTPPAHANNALQAHVARLRRLLPEPYAAGPRHEWITTGSLGYALRLEGATTDVRRFHELLRRGRELVRSDPARAALTLRRGLALWRGPALEGTGSGSICTAEVAQLEEQRLTALETLYEACLSAGEHAAITAALEELTAEHPMRERFYDLLMLALYRGGRQAEALSVYDRARKRLVHELGVEPGPALRARLEAVLRHDPALDAPGDGPSSAVSAATEGTAFGGSQEETAGLQSEIARLRRHVERLTREQADLTHRFNQLAGAPGR